MILEQCTRTLRIMSVESGYAASQKGKLNQHVEAVHTLIRIRNYVCCECGQADSQKGSLVLHIKQVHLKIRSFVCEECGFVASEKVS